MSHSLIGADRGTHCRIVAAALAGAIVVVLAGSAARESGAARPPGKDLVRATATTASAGLHAPAIR
jgi:hypothetical protein